MRKIVMAGLASAVAVVATPAFARDDAAYVGLEAGVLFPDDLEVDGDPATTLSILGDTDMGWDADVLAGYDFGPFRLEAEGGYKTFDVDELNFAGTIPGEDGPITGPVSLENSSVDIWSAMLNGLVDVGGNDGIGLSLGGGIGYAWSDTQIATATDGIVDDKDSDFAWQLLAMLRVPVSKSVDLGVKYRYFNTKVEGEDTFGDRIGTDIQTHSILASLLFNFGGAEPAPPPAPPPPPPPPPPPAPPPPPPPPVAQCNQGPYIVFFDWDKSDITPEAATILDSATVAYGNCGSVPIMLAGYTDRSGSEDYNIGLAGRRNASVTSYLTMKGIPGSAIQSEAFGEANPRVPTADGVRELQNRRVEITYGPGSGN